MCSCPAGFTGNAFIECRSNPSKKMVIMVLHIYKFKKIDLSFIGPVISNPCNPSPCGPNSRCREVNNQAVCSCIIGFIGQPPSCRPECVTNSDCARHEACINQKCVDPCLGTCGINAQCKVINHNPICSCPSHYTGNPFIRCEHLRKNMNQIEHNK